MLTPFRKLLVHSLAYELTALPEVMKRGTNTLYLVVVRESIYYVIKKKEISSSLVIP